jgi:GNAT superfamily N-acetyltransferase
MHRIETVSQRDLPDLLPLVRAYCDFYGVDPLDDALLALSEALITDPEREGVQLIARDGNGRALGFATVFWSWSTLSAARIAVMNDLYVSPAARGSGLAEALIEGVPGAERQARRARTLLADGEGQRARAAALRAHGREARGVVGLLPKGLRLRRLPRRRGSQLVAVAACPSSSRGSRSSHVRI